MPVRVSVVVPVYNPGRYIEPLVDSLLAQTIGPTEFEVILVDDGSTDATPGRLDELARDHPHFHVIHQPNSGWPGKPRNVGIDRAHGDYVFFSDHDDWFGPEALERLVRVADNHDADIVIGRMVGHNRGVPRELFRRDRFDATIQNAQLEDSLTPHKLFRRRLLVDHGLRFPEGKRRLEDHVFVMQAYFAAERISVVGDYDYYHHISRDDESNAGFGDIDPWSYYGYVRETVDVVLRHTTAGRLQDRLLRRFLTIEVLARLSDPQLAQATATSRRDLFDAARRLVVETMPPSVDAGMRARHRLLAALLRAGDQDALERMAALVPTARAALTAVTWEGATVRVGWRLSVTPALLRRSEDGRWSLAGAATDVSVETDLQAARVDVVAVDDERGERVVASVPVQVDPDGRLTAASATVLDPIELGDGTWRLRLRMRALGWVVDARALLSNSTWRRLSPAVVGEQAVLVQTAAARSGTALIDVGARAAWLDDALVARVRVRGQATVLPVTPHGTDEVLLRVGSAEIPARIDPSGLVTLARGTGPLSLRARGDTGRWIPLGVDVADGRPSRRAGVVARARLRRMMRTSARWLIGPVDRRNDAR